MQSQSFVLPSFLFGALLLAACGGGGSVTLPDTPEGTAQTFVQEIQNANARVVWDAMPSSYQKDVSGLVHQFGQKMDQEVLTKAFGTVDKLGQLLEQKRDWIAESMKSKMKDEEKAKVDKQLDAVTGMIKTIAGSDLRSASSLKSLDVGAFLGSTGSKVLGHAKSLMSTMEEDPFAEMKKMSFEAGEAKDGVVPVQALEDGKKKGPPEKFKQVDGKWIPVPMAEDWPEMMADAKKNLEQLDIAKDKKEILAGIGQAEQMIDGLLKTETKEEFEKQIEGMMGQASMMLRMLGIRLPF